MYGKGAKTAKHPVSSTNVERHLPHIPPHAPLTGTPTLPASKSISNRALIIDALSGHACRCANIAHCDDTDALRHALHTTADTIDIGAAGTAMRFLTAFFATQQGRTVTLTGSARMLQRPIGPLVDALRTLGADIAYAGQEGFPPLRINGKKLHGSVLTPHFGQSSQYFSALMMIAPYIEGGLTLHLADTTTSWPYVELTAAMMRHFGAQVALSPTDITIEAGHYAATPFTVENDWSAASYWYELLAIARRGSLVLPQLQPHSWQGDAHIAELFEAFGITTQFGDRHARITYTGGTLPTHFAHDFSNIPDMAQTFAVLCCALGVTFAFSGLHTLRIKETDRIAALTAELRKCGFVLAAGTATLAWDGTRCTANPLPHIATYNDHRMAMAFAPLATLMPIVIEQPDVVSKSYPDFWHAWEQITQ